jgi:hypothetical protein
MHAHNKLECSSLANLSSLVLYLQLGPEPVRVERLKDATL